MADPTIMSASIVDAANNRKTAVQFLDPTLTLADLQTSADTWLADLDPVIDGKIVSVQVTIPLAVVGGLKSAAVDGNRVHEGALLSYSADGTSHRYSTYVPSWKNAGFVADSDEVANTGAYATYISYLLANTANDDFDALTAYLEGERTFRK